MTRNASVPCVEVENRHGRDDPAVVDGRALHVGDDVANELGVDAALVKIVTEGGRGIAALRLDELAERGSAT